MEAHLIVEQGPSVGSEFMLYPGKTATIGRGPGVEIALSDPTLAPRHATLKLDPTGLLLLDHGAPGGTALNERPIPPTPVSVGMGDTIRVGSHVLRVDLYGDDGRPIEAPERAEDASPSDEFERIQELGRGAAGIVFAARRKTDGLPVAIKLLNARIESGSPEHQRFLREHRIGGRIQSPYVAQLLDLRVQGGSAFIVMELVQGPSLDTLLHKHGALPIPDALRVCEDVSRALVAAVAVGVVHRDVKPANVLISPQGLAKLTDFGIAKSLAQSIASLTASGQGLGSMAYMPPEQIAEAKEVDPRADVYSLGATLYHTLAGVPPFSPTDLESLLATAEQEPPPLGSLRPDAPPEVGQIVHAALAKEPYERPNARQLTEWLQQVREHYYAAQPLQVFGLAP